MEMAEDRRRRVEGASAWVLWIAEEGAKGSRRVQEPVRPGRAAVQFAGDVGPCPEEGRGATERSVWVLMVM